MHLRSICCKQSKWIQQPHLPTQVPTAHVEDFTHRIGLVKWTESGLQHHIRNGFPPSDATFCISLSRSVHVSYPQFLHLQNRYDDAHLSRDLNFPAEKVIIKCLLHFVPCTYP